jgi:hypothetical protein
MSLQFSADNLPTFHSVELPCFFQNAKQGLECIGGIETAQELVNPNSSFCFRFPGENPTRSHLQGTVKQNPTLLLKIVRRRNKKTGQVISEEATVVGVIKKTVVFDNPADYQVRGGKNQK